MVVEHPVANRIPALRQLWKLAFGDTEAYLDLFFREAFSPDHALAVFREETAAGALYWLDCSCFGKTYAYLYAVATHPAYRGQGLCRELMTQTHRLLSDRGYAGVLLVPQEAPLRKMYAKLGYRDCTRVRDFFTVPAEQAVPLRQIRKTEYASLRRQYLPEGGAVQEGRNLRLLAGTAQFYAGEDFLLCAAEQEGSLWGAELLGNAAAAPGILRSLGYCAGTFRTPGEEKSFAMFLPLQKDAPAPTYFGLAFD